MDQGYLHQITDRHAVITIIDTATRFPELLSDLLEKYRGDVELFQQLISNSNSIDDLLGRIRDDSLPSQKRMSLLKMFRRCVAPVLDTEAAKKIRKISTGDIVARYQNHFKPITLLREQFCNLTNDELSALVVLIGEYDKRGNQGYVLTERFFGWFEKAFEDRFSIEGPRRAGRDIELGDVFPQFQGKYPCDFIIKDNSGKVLCVGFARYDSTRGGAQSDDRTGGNLHKVAKAQEFYHRTGERFRILFVADGPGLTHKDTWQEACDLDGAWNDNVRVVTLAISSRRVTESWIKQT